ncbi:hypothetical protein M0R45_006326 [Rubus argutus]|uniref:Uncharacterized protein n=1 Tax=Rubus argutus TaxID=59490 RepID=A0AAW1YQW2_RUBAR
MVSLGVRLFEVGLDRHGGGCGQVYGLGEECGEDVEEDRARARIWLIEWVFAGDVRARRQKWFVEFWWFVEFGLCP